MVTLTLNTALLAIASNKELRTFALDEYDGVVGQQAYLALKCTKLSDVSCKGTFSDPALGDCVLAMAVRNPQLQKLRLPGNSWLRQDGLTAIAASCPSLQELCAQTTTPATLTQMPQGCPELTVVEGLSGPALTDASVSALTEHCPHLKRVCLDHSPQVTEIALTKLLQTCSKLHQLQVCASSMDAAAVKRIRKACAYYMLLSVNAPGRHDTVSDDFEDLGELGEGWDGTDNGTDGVEAAGRGGLVADRKLRGSAANVGG
jgi:hypothetical protein